MSRDPRITPARPDLAAAHLAGTVAAARFVEPVGRIVCVPAAPMTATPDGAAPMTTQLLFGERLEVLEAEGLWAWGQAALDGYVGYVPAACLDLPEMLGAAAPTHRVAAVSTHVYPEPQVRARPGAALTFGARVAVAGEAAAGWLGLASGGFVPARHLAPLDAVGADPVAAAETLLGVPYLWGGRSAFGIDCSGLVQVAMQAAGRDCPRDSDMQAAALGRDLGPGERLRRGDLVFWKGHVGIMQSATRLLHATGAFMAVVSEPLAGARARIRAAGEGPVTRIARLDGPARCG